MMAAWCGKYPIIIVVVKLLLVARRIRSTASLSTPADTDTRCAREFFLMEMEGVGIDSNFSSTKCNEYCS